MKPEINRVVIAWLVREDLANTPTSPATDDWPAYYGFMPEEDPANAIAVYNTSPIMNGRLHSGETIEKPGFQIKVRGADYDQAVARGRAIADAMDGIRNLTIAVGDTQVVVVSVKRTSGLIPIGYDEKNDRFNFTLNGIATYREV